MRFAWIVALRFLREGRFQSLLILVGVAAGVAVVTYISALIQGLQAHTIERTLGTQAHLVVKTPQERSVASRPVGAQEIAQREATARGQRLRSIDDWIALQQVLARTPGITAVTAVVAGSALVVRGDATRSATVLGIDLDGYDRIVALRGKIVQGQARLGPGEVILGDQLAIDLGVALGERIVLRNAANQVDTFTVTALVDLGSRELNRRSVYLPLRGAQSLLGLPGGATHVYATVADLFGAERLAVQLARQTGHQVESWMASNAQLLSALDAQTVSTRLIRAFTALVVMLGIASVLVVWVVQKRREIGILRAMGATRAQMTQVFLLQGALVGLTGSVAGVALAALLLWAFSHVIQGADGLPLFVVGLEPGLALGVTFGATLCGLIAAAAPARRAAQLDPAQAIRL